MVPRDQRQDVYLFGFYAEADGALDKARKHKKRQLEDTLNLVLKKRKVILHLITSREILSIKVILCNSPSLPLADIVLFGLSLSRFPSRFLKRVC